MELSSSVCALCSVTCVISISAENLLFEIAYQL